ncbi:hypothetical protein PIB30_040690 [Stylosanthes scabra]|uniref:Uncharacterized protein n=1 Tax=Stylosanthes scabra TaxID=79078 RepID=A0ABU6RFD7_9FABA|nr:hypothetical protein [Stylosanthes scabra]
MERSDVSTHHEAKKTTCSKVINEIRGSGGLTNAGIIEGRDVVLIKCLLSFEIETEEIQSRTLSNNLLLSLFNEVSPNGDIQGKYGKMLWVCQYTYGRRRLFGRLPRCGESRSCLIT